MDLLLLAWALRLRVSIDVDRQLQDLLDCCSYSAMEVVEAAATVSKELRVYLEVFRSMVDRLCQVALLLKL